jgi:hypothetical protein
MLHYSAVNPACLCGELLPKDKKIYSCPCGTITIIQEELIKKYDIKIFSNVWKENLHKIQKGMLNAKKQN